VRWLAQLDADIPVAFVPISIRYETSRPSIFYQALAARLAEILEEQLPTATTDPAEFYKEKTIEYLDRVGEKKERCLIVIDGLDEATGWTLDTDVVASRPFPELRFVASARFLVGDKNENGWLRRLGWDNASNRALYMPVPSLDQEGISDVLRSTEGSVSTLANNTDVLKELERLTNGDPLLLSYYIDDLLKNPESSGSLQVQQLRDQQAGFGPYFEDWLKKQGGVFQKIGVAFDEQALKAILVILACAIGPLKRREIERLMEGITSPNRIIARDTFEPLQRFVTGDGLEIGYSLGHPKLGEYLRNDYFGDTDVISRAKSSFVEWGCKTIQALESGTLAPSETPSYLLHFFSQHLQEERANPRLFCNLIGNGWRLAWESDAEGEANAGFSHDVEQAFTAIRTFVEKGNGPDFSIALAACIRCALTNSSIATLSSNIETELLLALVRESVRTSRWALAYIKRSQDSLDVAESLTALAPYVSDVQEEAIALARGLDDPVRRAIAIAGLSPRLSRRILDEALFSEFATYRNSRLRRSPGQEFISQDEAIASVLEDLAPCLPGQLVPDAASLIEDIKTPQSRWRAISALAPCLHEHERQSFINKELENVNNSALPPNLGSEALVALVPHLSGAERVRLLADVFVLVGQIDAPWSRAAALVALGRRLQSQTELSEAIALARNIPTARYRAEALAGFTQLVSPSVRGDLARETLGEIQQYLKEAATLRDSNQFEAKQLEYSARDVLRRIGPFLDKSVWPDAMAQAEGIHDARTRSEALSSLAAHFSNDLRAEALTKALRAAQAVDRGWGCARSLAAIPPQLPNEMVVEALATARSLEPVRARAVALSGLSQHVPVPQRREILEEALRASRVIGDTKERVQALRILTRHVSDPGDIIELISGAGYDLGVTSGGSAPSVLGQTDGLSEEARRAIIHAQPSELKLALQEMARLEPFRIGDSLISLAPYLPKAVIDDAISIARTVRVDPEVPLLALAKCLDEPHRSKIVEEVKLIVQTAPVSRRASLLGALVPHLSGAERQDAILHCLAAIRYDELLLPAKLTQLSPFVASLPPPLYYSRWCDLLAFFSRSKREQVVSGLAASAPILVALDGEAAIRSTIGAIVDVAEWWP